MDIQKMHTFMKPVTCLVTGFLILAIPAAASADTVQKQCAAQWKADKAAGKIPDGTNWTKYFSNCASDLKAPAPGTQSTTSSAKEATPPKGAISGKEQTPGQMASTERIKKCGAEWQAKKAANKLSADAKWPQFWSECSKRLKAAGQ